MYKIVEWQQYRGKSYVGILKTFNEKILHLNNDLCKSCKHSKMHFALWIMIITECGYARQQNFAYPDVFKDKKLKFDCEMCSRSFSGVWYSLEWPKLTSIITHVVVVVGFSLHKCIVCFDQWKYNSGWLRIMLILPQQPSWSHLPKLYATEVLTLSVL